MIYAECKPDVELIRTVIGLPRRRVIHELKGKGEVCNRLRKGRDGLALLDEDPTSAQPPYLRTMRTSEDLHRVGLKVLVDDAGRNRVVVLCPRLEDWVLAAAREEARLDVRDYSLPRDPGRLHRVINANLAKFERLLEALQSSSARRLTVLRDLLR